MRELEIQDAIVLSQWDGMQAVWGYATDYDEYGLLIRDLESGERIGWYATANDLIRALEQFGSYGLYHFIYRGGEWKSIPALVEFLKTYQYWDCE